MYIVTVSAPHSLAFGSINHYTSPVKSVTFDSLPVHTSYCSFNSIGRHHHGFYKDDELNDSDSETY